MSSASPREVFPKNFEEKQLSIDGLRRFYKNFTRNNFRQCLYINENTGWKIRISSQGIGEIRKFRKREHILLVKVLDKIIEKAIFYETVPDNKNTHGIENVSYFDCKCKVNNNDYTVRLTVKKPLNDNVRIFYYFKFINE